MEKIDNQTLAAYDARAAIFAQDWHDQPPPVDLHALIRRFFKPGGSTVDIGCGSGREVAWLVANGYPALGYDPSNGLLREARARYPEILFAAAALPELTGIPEATFDNVLCETVLMHLPPAAVTPSVARLLAILRPGGVLYLSWRVTAGGDARDAHGRLYAAFDKALVTGALAGAAAILFDQEEVSASSGKTVHRIIARKE